MLIKPLEEIFVNIFNAEEAKAKETKIGSIQKKVEEATEKTKKAADDAVAELKEAFKAQHIAEVFVPVANTDAAREAGEIVKNAVTNATAGATKVKKASIFRRSAISQIIFESSRQS